MKSAKQTIGYHVFGGPTPPAEGNVYRVVYSNLKDDRKLRTNPASFTICAAVARAHNSNVGHELASVEYCGP